MSSDGSGSFSALTRLASAFLKPLSRFATEYINRERGRIKQAIDWANASLCRIEVAFPWADNFGKAYRTLTWRLPTSRRWEET